jgi:hypothetical protein
MALADTDTDTLLSAREALRAGDELRLHLDGGRVAVVRVGLDGEREVEVEGARWAASLPRVWRWLLGRGAVAA